MKALSLLITTLLSITIIAQNLETKVPKEVSYLVDINTPSLLEKMSEKEMEKLPVFNSMVKQLGGYKKYDSVDVKLSDLGVSLSSNMYYFLEMTDSIVYFGALLPIKDVKKFEKTYVKSDSYQTVGGFNSIKKRKTVITWNDKYAILMEGNGSEAYFYNHFDVYKRNNIMIDTNLTKNYMYGHSREQKIVEESWVKMKIQSIIGLSEANSITTNESYKKIKDDKAAVTFWTNTSTGILSTYFSGFFLGYGRGMNYLTPKSNGGSTNAKLYFNDKDIQVISNMSLTKSEYEKTKKITDANLNSNFFKYFSPDNSLAYFTMAFNTEAMLEIAPNLMSPYFKISRSKVKEVYGDVLDLISVAIDEEALGKIIKGDGVFVLTDIVSKEVTYQTYEWDEASYQKREITKTKNEVYPEFLLMASTEDTSSLGKILKITQRLNKREVVDRGDYYEYQLYRNSPFKLYSTIKDGIYFMCNSEEQIKNVLSGKTDKPNLSAVSEFNKNTFNAYINGEEILSKIPTDKMSKKELNALEYSRKNVKNFVWYQNKPIESGVYGEMKITIPKKQKNGYAYILNYFNTMYEIDKGK